MSNPEIGTTENTLQELFSRDPLKLSDQDIGVIVAKFREQRAKWNTSQAAEPKVAKAPKASKKPAITLTDADLDLLNDLEIKA